MRPPFLIQRQSSPAFTLIELLLVMAIVSLLVGLTAPSMSGLMRGEDMNRASAGVAGVLDLARTYAVSQNTYTWVVMASDPASNEGVHAAILGSRDGSNTSDETTAVDLEGNQTYEVASGTGNLMLLRLAPIFRNVVIGKLSSSPAPTEGNAVEPNTTVRFRFPSSSAEAAAYLNAHPDKQQVVQFNPNGQARVSGSLVEMIELGIKSMKGVASDETNVSAIQVNGLTGQTVVYRN